MFYIQVFEKLAEQKIPYAVVGGLAVALHGAVRGTVDLDIVVALDEKSLSRCEKALQSLGLRSRIPVTSKEISQFREEYIKDKNLKAWSFVNPERVLEVVDVLIIHDIRDFKVIRKKIGITQVSLIGIEDLIKMKKKAGRPQDLEDVKALNLIRKNS